MIVNVNDTQYSGTYSTYTSIPLFPLTKLRIWDWIAERIIRLVRDEGNEQMSYIIINVETNFSSQEASN